MINVQFEKFNLNEVWNNSPTSLKYILVFCIFFIFGYFVWNNHNTKKDMSSVAKIEQSIEITYTLINRFDEFKTSQNIYNDEILDKLRDIYYLVENLNQNANKKLDLIIEEGGKNTDEIINQILILNKSLENLNNSYSKNKQNSK